MKKVLGHDASSEVIIHLIYHFRTKTYTKDTYSGYHCACGGQEALFSGDPIAKVAAKRRTFSESYCDDGSQEAVFFGSHCEGGSQEALFSGVPLRRWQPRGDLFRGPIARVAGKRRSFSWSHCEDGSQEALFSGVPLRRWHTGGALLWGPNEKVACPGSPEALFFGVPFRKWRTRGALPCSRWRQHDIMRYTRQQVKMAENLLTILYSKNICGRARESETDNRTIATILSFRVFFE